ncbi:hypothetical protein FJY68_08915 [candidate division WOR-3 bacterium]|uniref:DUF3300 domain-containing protein n=1 Tax=candidate division WOR-3 bacterium TaxID=2052148 RepID=A0A937XEJ6_UNCW3|nr:hypothetical protein [candidate division WOR-3 bacterium]
MRTCILICLVCILAAPQADARRLGGATALSGSPGTTVSGAAGARAQTTAGIAPALAHSILAVLVSPPPFRYHYVIPGISLTGQHPGPHRYHYVTPAVHLI